MKINIIKNEDGTSSVICPHCGDNINIGIYDKEDTHGDLHYIICENCHDNGTNDLKSFEESHLFWDKEGNLFPYDDVRMCDSCGKAYLEESNKIIIADEDNMVYYCPECNEKECKEEQQESQRKGNKGNFLRICNIVFHKDIMNYCCELEKHSIMNLQQTHEIAKDEYNEKFIKIFDEYYKTQQNE